MGLLDLFRTAVKLPAGGKPIDAACPKCKAKVNTAMERCPGCGTRIASMFRIECPKCKTANDLDAAECVKCKESLRPSASGEAPSKSYYNCPLCGYRADYYMMSCPACGVKFV